MGGGQRLIRTQETKRNETVLCEEERRPQHAATVFSVGGMIRWSCLLDPAFAPHFRRGSVDGDVLVGGLGPIKGYGRGGLRDTSKRR
jgi:hypothetical protein